MFLKIISFIFSTITFYFSPPKVVPIIPVVPTLVPITTTIPTTIPTHAPTSMPTVTISYNQTQSSASSNGVSCKIITSSKNKTYTFSSPNDNSVNVWWDFGDGWQTSSSHTFSDSGSYSIKLKVQSKDGRSTSTCSTSVNIE